MQKLRNNQDISKKIEPARITQDRTLLILGILSWLGFSYLFILYIKISQGGSIYKFPWHWDAPLWAFAESLIGAAILIGIKRTFGLLSEKSTHIKRDFIILILTTPFISFLIALIILSLNLLLRFSYTGGDKPLSFDFVMGFLHAFILQTFVSSTCIGYFYLTLVNKTKERLLLTQQAKTAMELKTLRRNIEPHFLFNNLNVLSSLIEKNPEIANEFLDKLAQLYRYILHTQNAEVVSIKEELNFAENYLYLIKKRFGTAYNFDWQISKSEINGQMIVPTALQSLLENVVKHNAGSRENPLQICVKFDENYLIIENEMRPKLPTDAPSGTGLQNLRARYMLLTENPLEILKKENTFEVKIPLVQIKK
jgi:hypothetical protein